MKNNHGFSWPEILLGIVALFFALLIGGCFAREYKLGTKTNTRLQDNLDTGRFKVELVGIFRDTMAYDGRRGIYLLQDSQTGKEYFGISGVGISELGSHSSGKTTISDER